MRWQLEQPIDVVIIAINLVSLCILVDVVLSWIALAGGHVPWYNPVIRWIRRIANAVLDPIRNMLYRTIGRPGVGGLSLDLSPLIALILLQILTKILWELFG